MVGQDETYSGRRLRAEASEVGKCFLCAWQLREGEYSRANVRTDDEPWRQVRICDTCARKVESADGTTVLKNCEHLTVRVEKTKKP